MTSLTQSQLEILQAVITLEKTPTSAAITAITHHDVAEALNLDAHEVLAHLRRLEKIGAVTLKNLTQRLSGDWWTRITSEGRMALQGNESFFEHQTKNGGNIAVINGSNNQIQQDVDNSTQTLIANQDNCILSVLEEIRHRVSELSLDPQTESELLGDIEAVKALSKAPNPRPAVLRAALEPIKGVLEKISTATVVKAIADKTPSWIESIASVLHHLPI
jgi:DNA-binding MarR family transcriptional regulator